MTNSLCGVLLLAGAVALVDAHGSLTLPVPRNNKGAEPPFGRTIYHNPGCQGDACLWFNEGKSMIEELSRQVPFTRGPREVKLVLP